MSINFVPCDRNITVKNSVKTVKLLTGGAEDNTVPSHSSVEGVTTRSQDRRSKWIEVQNTQIG